MPDTHKTASGFDENVAGALCYSLGWITGVVFLMKEPSNRFVRFHAWQSTIAFAALSVGCILLQSLPILGMLVVVFLLLPVSAALWLILMFKAYKGERFKLPLVGDMAELRI